MGAIALPEMRKYGYNDSLSSASIAAGGALGVIIPPSVIFIVYGISTQQSIGKLFIAGIIPGILLMLFYMLAIYIVVKRKPSYGPVSERFGWKERIQSLGDGLFEVLLIFVFSLGGLFAGWFTPTEAGAVGTASMLLVTVLRKHMNLQKLRKSLIDTVRTASMIMLMVAGAMVFWQVYCGKPSADISCAMGGRLAPALLCNYWRDFDCLFDFGLLHRCVGINTFDDPHLLSGCCRYAWI